jgi:hypothetical protein
MDSEKLKLLIAEGKGLAIIRKEFGDRFGENTECDKGWARVLC